MHWQLGMGNWSNELYRRATLVEHNTSIYFDKISNSRDARFGAILLWFKLPHVLLIFNPGFVLGNCGVTYRCRGLGGWLRRCFTNVSRALQNNYSKFMSCRNPTSYENFKLKICTCAQSRAFGTRAKFQPEMLTINVISGIVYFRKIILESSRPLRTNVCEILTKIHTFACTKMNLKRLYAKWRPFCLGLNVLI